MICSLNEIRLDPRLDSTTRYVGMQLVASANRSGVVRHKGETMAKRWGLSRSTVDRCKTLLVAAGYLVPIHMRTPGFRRIYVVKSHIDDARDAVRFAFGDFVQIDEDVLGIWSKALKKYERVFMGAEGLEAGMRKQLDKALRKPWAGVSKWGAEDIVAAQRSKQIRLGIADAECPDSTNLEDDQGRGAGETEPECPPVSKRLSDGEEVNSSQMGSPTVPVLGSDPKYSGSGDLRTRDAREGDADATTDHHQKTSESKNPDTRASEARALAKVAGQLVGGKVDENASAKLLDRIEDVLGSRPEALGCVSAKLRAWTERKRTGKSYPRSWRHVVSWLVKDAQGGDWDRDKAGTLEDVLKGHSEGKRRQKRAKATPPKSEPVDDYQAHKDTLSHALGFIEDDQETPGFLFDTARSALEALEKLGVKAGDAVFVSSAKGIIAKALEELG